ncbi:hypothetical protein CVT24_009894 [Panaeolus cyanescens]|uniref:G domain-containing protein n=1 Tax=Panaeolus cyanescens TaxID=181874 RepID=A0A409WWE0_9AGAR|nr:hypothetical protein CVT24_009894 [Panaeolus cyanescens]
MSLSNPDAITDNENVLHFIPQPATRRLPLISLSGSAELRRTSQDNWTGIKRIVDGRIEQASAKYLLMGPTGSGKSSVPTLLSFVEALGDPSQRLGISKNQLESYTHTVTAYQVLGLVHHKWPVYVIDTPGFCDNTISEVEIMKMITHWMKYNGCVFFFHVASNGTERLDSRQLLCTMMDRIYHVDYIIYMIPITDTRLSGTRRRVIDMMTTFVKEDNNCASLLFATSMWDVLQSDKAKSRATRNYAQLMDDVFAEPMTRGVALQRFHNTQQSALSIMDQHFVTVSSIFTCSSLESSPILYQALLTRINALLDQYNIIEQDLAQPETQENHILVEILNEQRIKLVRILVEYPQMPGDMLKRGRSRVKDDDTIADR